MPPPGKFTIIEGQSELLRDHLGQPVPVEPRRRLVIQVIWGSHWTLSHEFTISGVNRRSFIVSHRGQRWRLPRRRWRSFLQDLLEDGPLRFVYLEDTESPPPAQDEPRLSLLGDPP